MRIPEEIKARIFTDRHLIKAWCPKIIMNHMRKGIALEFIYVSNDAEDSNGTYYETAPICLKEVDGDWYMVGSDGENKIGIYALNKIKSIGSHWITCSLPANIDYSRFMDKYFDIGKVL